MEQSIKFIPLDYDYFDYEGRNYAKVVGRSDDGKKVCVIDSCDVYFWAIVNEGVSEKKIDGLCKKIDKIKVKGKVRDSRVLKTEVHNKNYLGKTYRAIKIFITNYKDAHDIVNKIDFKEIYKRREHDLGFITKYIMERKLRPLRWYEINGEVLNNSLDFGGIDASLDVDICLKLEGLEELDDNKFRPKILAYDIETDEIEIGKGEILMISLVGEDPHKSKISGNSRMGNSEVYKKVLTWKGGKGKIPDYVEQFEDEGEMLEKFVEYVKEYDPDILTGYFSDGFDLPYLRARAEKNRVKLGLGIDGSQPSFSRGRLLSGKIKGIVHIDLFRFIRVTYSQYLQSETLGLNDVANELLGEKKVKWEHTHSSKVKDWNKYFEYNLKDSLITYKLADKLWPDLFEFTQIIQEPLFDVSRYSMSNQVESYIIHNLEKFDEIVEKNPIHNEIGARRAEEKYEGAFVFQPIPGLYEDLVFFDFTSMYGSVIVSFNLSRSTLLEKKDKNSILVDIGKKVYFSKKLGFFSEILKDLIDKRKKSKKEYNNKISTNS